MSDIRSNYEDLLGAPAQSSQRIPSVRDNYADLLSPSATPSAPATLATQFGGVFADPDFGRLQQLQRELRDRIADPNAEFSFGYSERSQVATEVEQLTDMLTIKYGLTRSELGELLGINNRNYELPDTRGQEAFDTVIGAGAAIAGAGANVAGRVFIGGAEVLEPLQVPQQILFRSLQAQARSRREGASFGETLRNIADAWGTVEYGKAFGPGFQENFLTFGEVLREVGVENDTAVRTLGFIGDLVVDPLLGGSLVRGVGRLSRVAGAVATGEDLIDLGYRLDRAVGPAGVVSGARSGIRRVLGQNALDALDNRSAAVINNFLNTPVFGRARGEWIFARGQNPFMPDRSVYEGGAGRPQEFLMYESQAAQTADEVLETVQNNLQQMRDVFGAERMDRANRQVSEALSVRANVYERTRKMPAELKDMIDNLATETADNTSPLFSDEVMEALQRFRIRRPGESSLGTVGAELEEVRSAIPERSSVMMQRNRERVRAEAIRLGENPDAAEEAFVFMTNKLMESDALIGFHSSMYEPIKERFFEEVLTLGGAPTDAVELWREAIRMGGEGTHPRNLVVEAATLLDDAFVDNNEVWARFVTEVQNPNAAEVLEQGSVFITREGIEVEQVLTDLALNAGTQAQQIAARRVLLGRIFNRVGKNQLDIGAYFSGLANGHLRRSYALNDADFEDYLKSIEAGNALPNRLIEDEIAFNPLLQERLSGNTRQLIDRYLKTVSPTIPYERGFLVSQERLARFLMENGVDRGEAQEALFTIVQAMNPGRMDDLIIRLRDIQSRRVGAGQGSPGPTSGASLTSARLEPGTILTGPRAGQMVRDDGSIEDLVLNEVLDERIWDENAMAELGRLLETSIGIQESAQGLARKYPTAKFINDLYRDAVERGVVMNYGDLGRPRDWVLLDGQAYGPFDGQVVHPALKREIDNALRAAPTTDPRIASLLYSANRIRGAITGSWLANPSTTAANLIGGYASIGLYGENVLSFARDHGRLLLDVAEAGGIQNLPDYHDVADLFRSGVLKSQLSTSLRRERLAAIGATNRITDRIDAVVDAYQGWLQRPLGKYSGLLGLEAFQFSEDTMKFTMYRRELARSGDKLKAYQAARNVVFDYDSLPVSMRMLRDTGLILFPGFVTFMTGRVFNAIANRPGAVGALDRLGNSIWNAQVSNEEVRAGLFASMEDYQRNGVYIPIRQQGDRFSMLPLAQLIPVAPWRGNPLTESLTSWGIYQGVVDVAQSFGNQGEARIGGRYGNRVYEASAEGTPEQYSQIAQFLVNSYAPSLLRKLYQLPAGTGEASGVIPELASILSNIATPMPDGQAGITMRELSEYRNARPSRDLFENILTLALRSTQPISLNPALSRVVAGRSGEDYENEQVRRELNAALYDVYLNPSLSPEERQRRSDEILSRLTDMSMEEMERVNTVLRGFMALRQMQGQ